MPDTAQRAAERIAMRARVGAWLTMSSQGQFNYAMPSPSDVAAIIREEYNLDKWFDLLGAFTAWCGEFVDRVRDGDVTVTVNGPEGDPFQFDNWVEDIKATVESTYELMKDENNDQG